MEFFKQVDLDWMGKAKYFFALSVLLLVVGMASLIAKGGPYYGIDFKGGTVVDVRFAGTPPIDTIRNGLAQQGMGNSIILAVSDIARPNSNEVMIGLEEKGEGSEALDAGKTAILERPARHPGGWRTRQAGFQRRRPRGYLGCLDAQGSACCGRDRRGTLHATRAPARRISRQGSRRHRNQSWTNSPRRVPTPP